MPNGIAPLDIYHNGYWYNRDGVSGGPMDPAAIAPTGPILAAYGSAALPSYSFSGTPTTGWSLANGSSMVLSAIGVAQIAWNVQSYGDQQFGAGGVLRWGATALTGADLALQRDAANTLAQRNGTAAQTFNLYNTYTDASNYERLSISWVANNVILAPTATGTGIQRDLQIGPTGNAWMMDTSNAGNFYPLSTGKTLGRAGNQVAKLYIDYTNTATVGAVTINKAAGRVNIAAAGTSIVVTNSYATANSEIFAVVSNADATAYIKNVVPAAGSFTITLGAAATAQTAISFFIVNTD